MTHVDVERLRVVGEKLTQEQWGHLGICPDCFLRWREFAAEAGGIPTDIEDSQPDPEIE
jgi:hypothetical protein